MQPNDLVLFAYKYKDLDFFLFSFDTIWPSKRSQNYFFINLQTEEHYNFAKVYLDEKLWLVELQFFGFPSVHN